MRFAAVVEVTGLDSIADPQGQTIERALPVLGFSGIEHVRVGKLIRFQIEAASEDEAMRLSTDLCGRLLSNPVIEKAHVSLTTADPS